MSRGKNKVARIHRYGIWPSPGEWRLLPWISSCPCGCGSVRFSFLMFNYSTVRVDANIANKIKEMMDRGE